MLTHLRWPFMAGEIPSGEGSVFHFLDIFALGCGLEACAALFNGKSLWLVAGGVAGAVGFHLLGTKWPVIKLRLWPRLASGIEAIASNRSYRFGALALVVGYFAFAGLLYIHDLRSDLNAYAMPRTITEKQANRLRDYLSRYPVYAVTVRVVSHDQEALEYAAELANALKRTNWDATGPSFIRTRRTLQEPKPGDVDSSGKPVYKNPYDYTDAKNAWLEQEIIKDIEDRTSDLTELCIDVELAGQPTNPDPRHPAPWTILRDALHYAGITSTCGGGQADTGTNRILLDVGHRPRILGDRETLPNKIRRLIRSW
jgi:hypothetical protein